MKTIISTLTLLLALLAMNRTFAQHSETIVILVSDTVATTQTTDGEYMVRKYVVENDKTIGYSIQYPIGSASLSTSFDRNAQQIDSLDGFMQKFLKDTLLRVRSIDIIGYASPDGSYEQNQRLALLRAEDMKNYINEHYTLSAKYDVSVQGVVESWSVIRPAIEDSQIVDKQRVLSIVDSRIGDQAKMQQFKSLPYGVWSYIRAEILPPLRRVEVEVLYKKLQVSEERIALSHPTLESASVSASETGCCCCPCVDPANLAALLDSQVGIIINMDEVMKDADVDF